MINEHTRQNHSVCVLEGIKGRREFMSSVEGLHKCVFAGKWMQPPVQGACSVADMEPQVFHRVTMSQSRRFLIIVSVKCAIAALHVRNL